MNLREQLELAESLVQQHGNLSRFSRCYNDYRQLYGISTAIELALDDQKLLGLYSKESKLPVI